MKHSKLHRNLAAVLALVMVLSLLPLSALPVRADTVTHTLDVSRDMEPMGAGSKADGDTLLVNDYFTVIFGKKTKIDSSKKDFSDGYSATLRLNFQGATDAKMNYSVKFTTSSAATIKIWWVAGDPGRSFAIYDTQRTIVSRTENTTVKNALHISELTVDAAGTYYLGLPTGNNYLFRMDVTQDASGAGVDRADWGSVARPEILSAADSGNGEIKVKVKGVVGADGADQLLVNMYDTSGNVVDTRTSSVDGREHELVFLPKATGRYTFRAVLTRAGETDKDSENTAQVDFILPLEDPVLTSGTSKGQGKVEVQWIGVPEATAYEILVNGEVMATTAQTVHMLEGLTVGSTYTLQIVAIRGEERTHSQTVEVVVTEDAKQTWGFTVYGPSTNEANNGYIGSVNDDGYVTVYSESGRGKITTTTDGVAFYYTQLPTSVNFTLRAKVTVDSWTYSNGQEGFGLMVTDSLGTSGDQAEFWTNQYMAVATKIEYYYDLDNQELIVNGTDGSKYSMKLGLGAIAKTGITKDNLQQFIDYKVDFQQTVYCQSYTLETAAGKWAKDKGTYNVVGNCTNTPDNTLENALTTFVLEIQKNNTGYFITYYDEAGQILGQKKFYEPDAMSQLDEDYVYAGFFAARNARATFSDVVLTTIDPGLDAPAEEKPVTKIDPKVTVESADASTSADYQLLLYPTVSGTIQVTLENEVIIDNEYVTGGVRYRKQITLPEYGEYRLRVRFTPDPDQVMEPDTVLSTTADQYTDFVISYNRGFYHRSTIYVSPTGLANGAGTREYPLDIYTAIKNVVPGQTIILMEGTYKLRSTVKIQRGIDGTEADPIHMIADPQASTRPVLDFQRLCAGIVHGGDYWYFYGFDVTNSANGEKGFQVSGNYNVLDQIHAYYNGNTGIQISRYSGKDLFEDWPSYNLILNCTSYGNADAGYEDADGFAAKLTVGEGNVFDGCVAYHNADDGYDLYAKPETGPIGSVTIRNCIAYANGILEDGTVGGNGNGFKLGGQGITGKHILENSYAFFNREKGIDSNSCPDVIVRNCISYNNGSHNVAFYDNYSKDTDFVGEGIISFKDSTIYWPSGLTVGDKLNGTGTQDRSKYIGETNYYWNGSAAANASGTAVGADIFVSLEFTGVERKADGTIELNGFLQLSDKAPGNAGADGSGTASGDVQEPDQEQEHQHSDQWFNEDTMFHWRECECGDKADMAEHTLQWIIDLEPTESTPGSKHEECTVCGYKKPAITTYYEKPAQPTEPAPTQPSAPQQPPVQPAAPNPMTWIIPVVAAAAVIAGVVIFLVIKKKKQ